MFSEVGSLISAPNFLSKLDSTQDNKLPSQVHHWGFKRRDEAKGKGKIVWPGDLQTLNPWPTSWVPPWELSKSLSQTSHLDFVSVTFTRAVTPGALAIPLHFNTPGGGREGGRDESYRGWIVLVIKIKHTPQEFLADSHYFRITFFFFFSSLPSSHLSSAYTKDGRGSERVRDMLTRGC